MRIVLIGLKIHPSLSMQRNSVGTLASVGAMVIVILCMKFLALYMVLLSRMADSSFYFASMPVLLVSGVTLPIPLGIMFFCLYPSMYNCPLKGSEGSQVNIVTLHRQTSNGGTAGLRRSKRLLDSKLQTRATQ